jgi:hypothetical protein
LDESKVGKKGNQKVITAWQGNELSLPKLK